MALLQEWREYAYSEEMQKFKRRTEVVGELFHSGKGYL